ACLVPAFAVGVTAGLGQPVPDDAQLKPSWGAAPTGPLRLPVYDSWEVATGPEGGFETLVRKLHPAPLDPTAAQPPALNLGAAGSGLPAAGVVGVQSALRVPGPDDPPAWPDAARMPFQTALERLLGTTAPNTLAPPVYGQVQAGASGLPAAGTEPAWLRELDLDPRLRVAAAAGTRVVQDRQERLMARACGRWGRGRPAGGGHRRPARPDAAGRARRGGQGPPPGPAPPAAARGHDPPGARPHPAARRHRGRRAAGQPRAGGRGVRRHA